MNSGIYQVRLTALDRHIAAIDHNKGEGIVYSLQDKIVYEQADTTLILVVDDNLIVQEMICWALKLAGYRVATCTGIQMQAWIDTACTSGHIPALLLIDLSISWQEEDVYHHLVLIRQKFSPHIPPAIIVLTTVKKVYDALSAIEEIVIQKPFHIQDLLQAVRKVAPSK